MDASIINPNARFDEFQKRILPKYEDVLNCFYQLEGLLNRVLEAKPATTKLDKALRLMLKMSANSCRAVQLLVFHGFGNDAFALSRTIFEACVNAAFLAKEPDKAADYLDFTKVIWKKQIETLEKLAPDTLEPIKELIKEANTEFEKVRFRFLTRSKPGKKARLRDSWSKLTLRQRAEKVNMDEEYEWVYPEASSSVHLDIGAVSRQFDFAEMDVPAAPTETGSDLAIYTAYRYLLRLIDIYDRALNLGLQDDIQKAGPEFDKAWRRFEKKHAGDRSQVQPSLSSLTPEP